MTQKVQPQPALSAFDLIDDPLVGLMMERDGVRPEDLRGLIERVQRRLSRRTDLAA